MYENTSCIVKRIYRMSQHIYNNFDEMQDELDLDEKKEEDKDEEVNRV